MSSDFSIGSFDEDDFGVYRDSSFPHCSREESFHTRIHPAIAQSCHRFHATALPGTAQPITQAYRSNILRVNSRPNSGGPDDDSAFQTSFKGTCAWGDPNGPTFSVQGDMSYQLGFVQISVRDRYRDRYRYRTEIPFPENYAA